MLNVNLSNEARYGTARWINSNLDVNGTTYPSAYSVEMNINGTIYGDTFAGSFSTDASGAVTGGTVSAYYEYLLNGSTWVLANSVTGFSYSALDFYNAAISGVQSDTARIEANILSGNDVINGSTGNDTLYGGNGNDVINGGGGIDTVVYNDNRSDYTILEKVDGSISVANNISGDTDTLHDITYLAFADQTGAVNSLAAPPHFNNDLYSDILWQSANGQAAIWQMNGTNVIGGGLAGPDPGPSWKEIGTGDFNGDGYSGILWQNTNGQAEIWEMNGTNVIGDAPAGPNPGPNWQAIGTGDFNGDGYSDILWQNTNGQAEIWEMNGTNVIGDASAGPNPGPNWHAIGTGDFNGDGHSDILWQNTNGQAEIWEMNGTNVIGMAPVGPNLGPSWQAIKA
jgi:hypothetical protein